MGHGQWISRNPPIRKEEWRAFVASFPELQLPRPEFGDFPTNLNAPDLPEFVWWVGSVPCKVTYSRGDILVEEGGTAGREFAERVANYFGGVAEEL